MNNNRVLIEEDLILHIDLPYHYLTVNELTNYVNSINEILNIFNKIYFNDKEEILLLIKKQSDGGIIIDCILKVSEIVVECFFSEIALGIYEELTGKNLKDQTINKVKQIKDSIIGFIKKKPKDLENFNKLIPQSKLVREAIKSKNLFYKTAISNPDNKGFCFNRTHNFDIKRADYENYLYEIDDDIDYDFRNMKVKITSPDSEGKSWRGFFINTDEKQDKQSKSFSFRDKNFLDNNKHISTNEFIYGQFLITKGNRQHISLIRVLEYKDQQINSPLTKEEISKIVKKLNEDEFLINNRNDRQKKYKNITQMSFDFMDD